ADVRLKLEQIDNAIMIPSEAVIPGLDQKNVFVMKDGKAVQRAVETGTRTSSTIHVVAGLKPGDVLITSGLQQLRPGQAVASIDASADKSESRKRRDAQDMPKDAPKDTARETTGLAGSNSVLRTTRKTDKS
ncbi:MAG TPA: hypothetical protein VHL14_15720, partial [Steroidobacteraceae bacterium]|nr:hypothetical protein [Steroidobacteraceae bacterium]